MKSAHLTARESVNIDDLINCDFFMMLSGGVRHVESGDTGRWIYLYCHSALAEEQLPAGVSCCASLLTTPYGAHEGELSVALYVRNYVHQTPPHHTSLDHLTSYPLLCICYFIIQLILYNVVRRRNFTQV